MFIDINDLVDIALMPRPVVCTLDVGSGLAGAAAR
jgi:hypothetical protein